MLTAIATAARTAVTALVDPPEVRIVAESAWGHVAVFTAQDMPAAQAHGWQPLGLVSAGGRGPARHARRTPVAA